MIDPPNVRIIFLLKLFSDSIVYALNVLSLGDKIESTSVQLQHTQSILLHFSAKNLSLSLSKNDKKYS